MVSAVPNDVSNVSTTSATPIPTIPIKIRTVGTRDACCKNTWEVEGEVVLPLVWLWWAWAKQIASDIPSNSMIMQREMRARVAALTAIELDVSSWTKMAIVATP
jgi:hypothetical protein